jgi:TonB-dependent receptor
MLGKLILTLGLCYIYIKPVNLQLIKKIKMTVRLLICVLSFTILSGITYSQTGTISGKIIDAKSGEELIGASVLIKGTGKGASSDINGFYKLSGIEPGTYSLICKYVSYKEKEITGVIVSSGKTTTINVTLEEAVDELDVVDVVAARITNTEAAVVEDIKQADQVISGMGSQQIKKSSDRDAAEVARRIPGVVVVDNRFMVIRGLSERYNAVLLNNALAPSAETDVKAFSFDLVPSQLIDKFLIYKSPSPDLPGEFAGGAVKIFTQNFPTNNELNIGYSSSYRSETTFNPYSQGYTGKNEKFSFGSKERELPENFPDHIRNTNEDLYTVSKSLPNRMFYKNFNSAPLDQRFNLSYSKRFDLKNLVIANITAITYSNTRVAFLSNRLDYNTYNEQTQSSDTVFYYQDSIFQTQTRFGALHNWAFKFGKNTIEWKTIFNQTGMNETTLRNGRNLEEGNDRKEYSFRYNQRTILTSQLLGNHKFFNNNGNLEWVMGYSFSKRNDPDWMRARYTRNLGTQDPFRLYIPFIANPFFLGRIYLNMQENISMGAVNYEHILPINIKSEQNVKIKAGAYIERKDRVFDVRNLGYKAAGFQTFGNTSLQYAPINEILNETYINSTNGIVLDEDTKGSDRYKAGNYLNAYYLMTNVPLFNRIHIAGGLRIEDNLQYIYSNRSNTGYGSFPNDSIIRENKIVSLLPSANISYHFIKDTLLIRAGYGKTVNRPEFRELSPMSFYDFVFNAINTGNDSLLTPTINNYDLRLEWYPRKSEMISIGAFHKQFINPIEVYFQPGVGSGGTRSFIPRNALSAESRGVEIEVRKSLTGITNSRSWLDDFTIVFNASFIKSNIKLAENASTLGVNTNRPMMGQSPYIFNAGIYYQNDSVNLQISLLHNVVGPKVVIVGIPGIPEVYEMPRNIIDLTITKGIGKYVALRFSIQDILNQQFLLLQDANNDNKLDRKTDQAMQFYRRGSYYTFGINVKL